MNKGSEIIFKLTQCTKTVHWLYMWLTLPVGEHVSQCVVELLVFIHLTPVEIDNLGRVVWPHRCIFVILLLCILPYFPMSDCNSISVSSGNKMEADSFPKPESNGNKSDEEEEEILGSDNDEQEDPKDYCKGFENCVHFSCV